MSGVQQRQVESDEDGMRLDRWFAYHFPQLGTPIIGDPRYFNIENWQGAPGLSEGLHLHARRIAIPLRNGKRLDISAPLPPHMRASFEALGFDPDRYDVSGDPEDGA